MELSVYSTALLLVVESLMIFSVWSAGMMAVPLGR
jgi:hypothetical protein